MRILLDPAATDGGEANPEKPAPEPTTTPPPAPADPEMLSVSAEEYRRSWGEILALREFKAQAEAARKEAVAAAQREALQKLAEEQGANAALEKQRADLLADFDREKEARAEIERSYLAEKRDATLARSLDGRKFASEAARDQFYDLMGRRLVAEKAEKGVAIRDAKTGLFADESSLARVLDGPEFSHFFAPTATGGTGSGGSNITPSPAPAKPMTVVEALLEHARAERAATPRPGEPYGLAPR